jgi:O-antigen/teichoic acid export membrane protein
MVRTLVQIGVPLLQAVGKPDIVLKWNLIYAPIYIFSIYTGYKISGLLGIAVGTTLCGVLGSIIFSKIIISQLNWIFSDFIDSTKPAVLSSLITGIILFFIRKALIVLDLPQAVVFVSTVVFGFLIYFLLIKFMFADTFTFVTESISKFVAKKSILENGTYENA